MTVIADYLTTLSDLLHDPSNQYWTPTQLARYVNQARTKLVMDTGCLRSLQTVYFTQGVEAYTFGQVTGASITSVGSGYVAPTVSFSGGGGSGVAATLGVSGGAVTSISFSSFGSGYTSAPAVSPSSSGTLASLTVASIGYNYSAVPTLSFAGGGGAGAAGTVTLQLAFTNQGFTAAGLGYVVGEIITLSGGTSTRPGRILVTAIGGGGAFVAGIVIDGGDYSAIPGAPISTTASAAGAGMQLTGLWSLGTTTITNVGAGYTSAPAVTINGGAPTIGGSIIAALNAIGSSAVIVAGVINVNTYDVLGVNLFRSGTMRYPLKWRPWSDFSTQMRGWVNQQREPAMWAVYGDNQIYVGPLPDQTYQAELDTIILPTDIAGATVDPIPAVAQAPIPYYAAHIAKFNDQRFGEASTFLAQYNQLTRDAVNAYTRRIPDPYSNLRP